MAFLSDSKCNAVEKAIVKFYSCNKKLNTFTEEELKALPKAFLIHVAANAVKKIWDKVPGEWTQDPVLSELQTCSLHHQQVSASRRPSVRQCRTCQLIKLYHGPKTNELTSLMNTYHGCEESKQADGKKEEETCWEKSEEACWAWTYQ